MRISDWSSDVCSSDLTTNGSQLERHAETLVSAGVKRINVSIDSLDPDRFAFITRWGRLDQVLRGVEAAKAAGLAVKINMVALKGVNDEELVDRKSTRLNSSH